MESYRIQDVINTVVWCNHCCEYDAELKCYDI